MLKFNLEKVPKRNKFYILSFVANNPAATTWLWDWFVEHVDEIYSSFPETHFDRAILSVSPIGAVTNPSSVYAFLDELKSKYPKFTEALTMAREITEVVARLVSK